LRICSSWFKAHLQSFKYFGCKKQQKQHKIKAKRRCTLLDGLVLYFEARAGLAITAATAVHGPNSYARQVSYFGYSRPRKKTVANKKCNKKLSVVQDGSKC
jgi:hypothetical protein